MQEQVCFLKNISKSFHGIPVLRQISIGLYRGEIHAIIGDNGVGKSTLMRILAGFVSCDKGEVFLDGVLLPPYNQYQAVRHGITYIAPDSVCVPDMTVLENMFLEDYPRHPVSHILDHQTAKERADAALQLLRFQVPLGQRLGSLGTAERKLVMLASILCHKSKILILDEVALGLTEYELESFYKELIALKNQGVSIFLVTQDLKKVFEIADQITMISGGAAVWSQRNSRAFFEEICQKISIEIEKNAFPKLPSRPGGEVLRVEELYNASALRGVNLSLRKGEIVGVLGTAGSGRTSLARSLFGLDRTCKGRVVLSGKAVRIRSAAEAKRHRIGFMEELTSAGLVPHLNCVENITLANVDGVSHVALLDLKLERSSAAYYLERLGIEGYKWLRSVRELSRGEQQKVLLSKWLFSNTRIMILDEPTIALDIASRVDVYNILSELAGGGISFLIMSSDIGELSGMCDRVYVMRGGVMAHELTGEALTIKQLVKCLSS